MTQQDDGGQPAHEHYWQRLARLREAAGLSRPRLAHKMPEDGDGDPLVSLGMLVAFEHDPHVDADRPPERRKSRRPSAAQLDAVATAIGVRPDEFPEYRLACWREDLDEGREGSRLGEALALLEDVEQGLLLLAEQRSRDRALGLRDAGSTQARATDPPGSKAPAARRRVS